MGGNEPLLALTTDAPGTTVLNTTTGNTAGGTMAFNDPVVLETDTVLTDTGGDSGTATDIGGAFSNVENLTGGSAADSFTLHGGTRTGGINGAAGADRLTGDNVASAFVLTGANSGTVTGVSGGFAGIESLTGGSRDDSFTFAANGTLSGLLDGGAHTTGDSADYSSGAGATVALGTNVVNIERLVGGGATATLSGGSALHVTASGQPVNTLSSALTGDASLRERTQAECLGLALINPGPTGGTGDGTGGGAGGGVVNGDLAPLLGPVLALLGFDWMEDDLYDWMGRLLSSETVAPLPPVVKE